LFCLLDPGQIRYRAIYTHPNQIPGYASGQDPCRLLSKTITRRLRQCRPTIEVRKKQQQKIEKTDKHIINVLKTSTILLISQKIHYCK